MVEQENGQIFNADYVRKLQADVANKKEEEQHFIDTFGIDKRTFEDIMSHIHQTIMSKITTTDTEVTIHVTEAYKGTPYWLNTNFRRRISQTIEKNHSKISMGLRKELEDLGFKVEAKPILEDAEFKEIKLTISW